MQGRERPTKRRIVIGMLMLVAVALAAVLIFSARQQHVEKMERTQHMAVEIIRSTEQTFESVEPLSSEAQSQLRQYRNKQHVETARQHGISRVTSRSEAQELSRENELVRIDSNPFYQVRRLEYSIPYVTPSAANLLDRIGHRFHEALAERGLPPYRFVVTSVTRSQEDQKALQQVNINAARESSHEYGTTFDLHYEQFDYTGQPSPPDTADIYLDELRHLLADGYAELAERHSTALKAILGGVLQDLQADRDALIIYERRQPVYHVTAARQIPNTPPRLRARATERTDLVNVAP